MSTAMQKPQQQSPAQNLKDLFARAAPSFQAVLPKHLTAERLVKVALAAINRTPKLLECTPSSLLQACMQAAELGLEPGSALGEAYLVPYKTTATMIPGYRGLITLARRSGQIEDIEAHVVRERDRFRHVKGTAPVLEHEPFIGDDPGQMIAVYGIGWVRGTSRPHVEVMTRADVDRIRKRSRASGDGPWVTDYEEMARKTVVRRLVKYLPMSVELARAIELDNQDFEDAPAIDAAAVLPMEQASSGFKGRVKAAASKAEQAPVDVTPVAEELPPAEREPGADDDR